MVFFLNTSPLWCHLLVHANMKMKAVSSSPALLYIYRITWYYGPGSSVGIATDYGLDGPGSNPGGDEIFRPSRPALGPTQPPIKWIPGLSQG